MLCICLLSVSECSCQIRDAETEPKFHLIRNYIHVTRTLEEDSIVVLRQETGVNPLCYLTTNEWEARSMNKIWSLRSFQHYLLLHRSINSLSHLCDIIITDKGPLRWTYWTDTNILYISCWTLLRGRVHLHFTGLHWLSFTDFRT